MTTIRKAHAVRTTDYAFILWGDKFDEEVAIIFATELRHLGICVKIVGLAGLQATGAHGLVMMADLTLGHALPLAHKSICVVVPCGAAILRRREDDPRITEFFQAALANNAQFVVNHTDVIEQTSLKRWSTPTTRFLIYTEGEDLIVLARGMAVSLTV